MATAARVTATVGTCRRTIDSLFGDPPISWCYASTAPRGVFRSPSCMDSRLRPDEPRSQSRPILPRDVRSAELASCGGREDLESARNHAGVLLWKLYRSIA